MSEELVTKEHNIKNKKILLFLPIIILVIVVIILLFLLFISKKKLPFVEKHDIEVLSFNKEYDNPVYFYSIDELEIEKEIEGLTFEDSNASYKFYDYDISTSEDDTIYTFKYDYEVPMNATLDGTVPYFRYTYSIVFPILFDYYTGEEYRIRQVTVDDDHNYYYDAYDDEDKDDNDPYRYTEITWEDNTYKIGVRTEEYSKWDGVNITKENNKSVYKDINRGTVTVYVKTPKDYDGVMLAIFKNGVNKESHEIQHKQYIRYVELLDDYVNTKEKSEELIKYEEKNKRIINLFESRYDENKKYTKEDFDVIRPEKK